MFKGTLLPYQVEAVDRMVERRQVLVAYDLGLGKTVITIAACEALMDSGDIDATVLVVCLSSLKFQWSKEISRFSDSTPLVVDGTKRQRQEQFAWDAVPDYVIVNYQQVVNDWEEISGRRWGALVLDEATAIKSFRAKRSRRVKELARATPIRFALTGTPIENGRPEEVYSIMEAVDSRVFGPRFDLFDQAHIVRDHLGRPVRYRNLDRMHERLRRACVRKSQTDPDVAPFLPDAIERDPILVPLDRHSAILYRRIVALLEDDLAEAQGRFGSSFSLAAHYGQGSQAADQARGRIMAKVTALRMLADDPMLLRSSAAAHDPMAGTGSEFAAELLQDPFMASAAEKARGLKADVLRQVVADHLETSEDAKAVVFCSFVEIADHLAGLTGGVTYTGRMSAREREDAKVAFQEDPGVRVLVSTDAGGYGVDLPQANMLINFDLPWSAGLAVQRNGRIRRASSKWPSIVIQDLLASQTLEERQHALLRQKRAVAAAVVDGHGMNADGGVDLTVGTLSAFLSEVQP